MTDFTFNTVDADPRTDDWVNSAASTSSGQLWYMAQFGASGLTFWSSDDNGATWTERPSMNEDDNPVQDEVFFYIDKNTDSAILLKPGTDPALYCPDITVASPAWMVVDISMDTRATNPTNRCVMFPNPSDSNNMLLVWVSFESDVNDLDIYVYEFSKDGNTFVGGVLYQTVNSSTVTDDFAVDYTHDGNGYLTVTDPDVYIVDLETLDSIIYRYQWSGPPYYYNSPSSTQPFDLGLDYGEALWDGSRFVILTRIQVLDDMHFELREWDGTTFVERQSPVVSFPLDGYNPSPTAALIFNPVTGDYHCISGTSWPSAASPARGRIYHQVYNRPTDTWGTPEVISTTESNLTSDSNTSQYRSWGMRIAANGLAGFSYFRGTLQSADYSSVFVSFPVEGAGVANVYHGATAVDAMYAGAAEVDALYVGSDQVF